MGQEESKQSSPAKCPYDASTRSADGNPNDNDIKLMWTPEIKPLKLRNYQTGETVEVTGPQANIYNDCRQHVCTSTFMPVTAHPHQSPILSDKPTDEFASLDPDYVAKEARAYLAIFHEDKKTSEADYEERLKQVNNEIQRTGTYKHTTEELEYGAQLAWRNSSRCINRLYWKTFKCIDRRDIKTNDEMFKAMCDHMRFAYNGGTLQASVLVMNPKSRSWSTQYFRYACYEQPDGTLLGDPTNRELTQVALELGWNKPEQERTAWDILPIIVQADLNEAPSLYEIPDDLRYQTFLSHPNPKYDQAVKSLKLRWFSQPYVADKAIEIGGIFYRCVPFSGWFMQSEIGRNLCDVQRYNLIPQIAKLLDLDITAAANSQLNVDRIYVEVNAAILYSFEKAKIAIVDHHTAATGFQKFMKAEVKQRGSVPCDWVWIVPPLSGGMSSTFHQEMLNFVLKPRICDQRDPWLTYTPLKTHQEVREMSSSKRVRHRWLVLRAARAVIGFAVVAMKQRISVNVLYASSSGTAYSYAQQMQKRLLHIGYNPVLMELDSFEFLSHKGSIRSINLIITSTFGQGNAPDGGLKVEEWLKTQSENLEIKSESDTNVSNNEDESESTLRSPLMWCTYAVCAIGSSAYPFYCGFGELVDTTFEKLGGKRLIPMATCDALNQQFKSYNDWEAVAIKTLRAAYPHACLTPDTQVTSPVGADPSAPGRQSFLEDENKFNTSIQPTQGSLEFYPDKKKEKINLAEQKGPFTKDNPYQATVVQNIELIGNQNIIDHHPDDIQLKKLPASPPVDAGSIDEEHSVRLIVFDTPDLLYHPGDHVCILPENTASKVNEFLSACGWQPDDERLNQHCSLASFTRGKYDTIREILTYHVDLSATPQPHVLGTISSYASDPSEQRQLLELGKGKQRYDDWKINAPTIKEMLDQFPSVKVPIDGMIQLLPNLQPRYYSISSSTRLNPKQLHVTVSVVTYATVRGIIRKGICSSFLQQTVPSSSQQENLTDSPSSSSTGTASIVRLFVIPNAYFRLPGQEKLPKEAPNEKELLTPLNNPMLMFAVGSGLAPFRSFWQELQVLQGLKGNTGSKVERVLFFGCRSRRDYLYAKELQKLSKADDKNDQLFTSVFPVYSRDRGAAKRYIQDAMLDNEQLIYSIITNENTSIYMCGSTRACQGVESVLVSILETSSNGVVTADDAQLRIKKLKQNGKIRQDMFG